MQNTTPTVMLNLFQHLIELWQSALSSGDPESSSGGRWVWQSAVLLKAALTFRHAEFISAPHRVVAWCYTSKDPFFFRHAELISASYRVMAECFIVKKP